MQKLCYYLSGGLLWCAKGRSADPRGAFPGRMLALQCLCYGMSKTGHNTACSAADHDGFYGCATFGRKKRKALKRVS